MIKPMRSNTNESWEAVWFLLGIAARTVEAALQALPKAEARDSYWQALEDTANKLRNLTGQAWASTKENAGD